MKRKVRSQNSSAKAEPRLTLVHGGTDYFEQLHRMIAEAQTELHVQTYIFDPDETGKAVVEALVAAAKRNVRVTLLVDAYGSGSLPKSMIETLQAAGVRIRLLDLGFPGRACTSAADCTTRSSSQMASFP
ncbi:MAG: hypothetical protein IPP17_29100 [Bacteroidetes bacterium]|nr:hypothetical protein [Bacteroidota bacterium]